MTKKIIARIICDRCGCTQDEVRLQLEPEDNHPYWKQANVDGRWLDLCPDCLKSLNEWLKNARVKQQYNYGDAKP